MSETGKRRQYDRAFKVEARAPQRLRWVKNPDTFPRVCFNQEKAGPTGVRHDATSTVPCAAGFLPARFYLLPR
jgi:hypothetical protein